jgi:four helix bundle protein
MKIEKFEDIESWKKAREFTKRIYAITQRTPFNKDFGLKDQIQRASVSIMANIAEGFDSGSKRNFIVFLNYAYRSASEAQSLLYVAIDLKYITDQEFHENSSQLQTIKSLIGGFIKYLKTENK